jgi:hypothetical protein
VTKSLTVPCDFIVSTSCIDDAACRGTSFKTRYNMAVSLNTPYLWPTFLILKTKNVLVRPPCYLCLWLLFRLFIKFWLSEQIFMKLCRSTRSRGKDYVQKETNCCTPSFCGSACVSSSLLLGTNSENTFPRQRRIFGEVVFYANEVSWWTVIYRKLIEIELESGRRLYGLFQM